MKVRRVHFAYDQMSNQVIIEKNLALFMDITGWGRQKVSVFILCNYDTTFDEDMHRVMYVKACGATPYVMLYNKQKTSERTSAIAFAALVQCSSTI